MPVFKGFGVGREWRRGTSESGKGADCYGDSQDTVA